MIAEYFADISFHWWLRSFSAIAIRRLAIFIAFFAALPLIIDYWWFSPLRQRYAITDILFITLSWLPPLMIYYIDLLAIIFIFHYAIILLINILRFR